MEIRKVNVNPLRSLEKGTISTYIDMASMPTIGSFPVKIGNRNYTSGMKFRNGDTILARITPCLENGKTAYVSFLNKNEIGWGSTEYIILSSKDNKYPEWNYFLARNEDFRDFAIQNMSGTSGRQRVSGNVISDYIIEIPDGASMVKFRNFASVIMNHVKCNSGQIITLTKLRDSLLPKLMSGKMRVKI